jgi:hypothetical protein
LPKSSSRPAGYSATLDLRSTTIKSGANLKGVVELKDVGDVDVRVDTDQPIEVVLTKPGTRRVVGVYSGVIAGTGYAPLLTPGKSQSVGIVGGTARCDGGIGSALPRGHYNALAEVSGIGVDGNGGSGHAPPTYFTSVERIDIVPN